MSERPPRNPLGDPSGPTRRQLSRLNRRKTRTDQPVRRQARQTESAAQAKARAKEQLLSQIEDDSITEDDIAVRQEDGQYVAELTEQAKQQERQEAKNTVAQDLLSQIDSEEITRDDITVVEEGGQFTARVKESVREELSSIQFQENPLEENLSDTEREDLAQQAINKLSDEYNADQLSVDIAPSGDVDVVVDRQGQPAKRIEDVITGGEGLEGPQVITSGRFDTPADLQDFVEGFIDTDPSNLQQTTVDGQPGVIVSGEVTQGANEPDIFRDPESFAGFDVLSVPDITLSDQERQELKQEAAAETPFTASEITLQQQFDEVVPTPSDEAVNRIEQERRQELKEQAAEQSEQFTAEDFVTVEQDGELIAEVPAQEQLSESRTEVAQTVAARDTELLGNVIENLDLSEEQETKAQIQLSDSANGGRFDFSAVPGNKVKSAAVARVVDTGFLGPDSKVVTDTFESVEDQLTEEQRQEAQLEFSAAATENREIQFSNLPSEFNEQILAEYADQAPREVQESLLVADLQQQFSQDLDRGQDFTVSREDGLNINVTESFRTNQAESRLSDRFNQEIEAGRDFVLSNEARGSVELTDSFQREQAASDFAQFSASELRITGEGDEQTVRPTETAREAEIENESFGLNFIERELGRDIEDPGVDVSRLPRQAAQDLFEAGILNQDEVTAVETVADNTEALNDTPVENQIEAIIGQNIEADVTASDPRDAARQLAEQGVIDTDEAEDVISQINTQKVDVNQAQQAIFGETFDLEEGVEQRNQFLPTAEAFADLARDGLTRREFEQFRNRDVFRNNTQVGNLPVTFDRREDNDGGGGGDGGDVFDPEADVPAAEQVAGSDPGAVETDQGAVEDFAAGTGQLDELAKDRAGVGRADVDLSEITQQDRQEIREQQIADLIQSAEAGTGPSVGQVATDVGQLTTDVERAAGTASQLAGAVGDVVVPEAERATPEFEGVSATQINEQVEAAESDTQTTAEQFSGVVDADTDAGAQQAVNTITRGFDVASENPRVTAGATTFIFGNPLAQRRVTDTVSGDVAAERANLGNLGGETAEDVEAIDVSPVGSANAQPTDQAIQATQARGLTTPDVSRNEEIAEDLTSGGVLTPSQEQELQSLSERYSNAARFVGEQAGNIAGATQTAVFSSGPAGISAARAAARQAQGRDNAAEKITRGGVKTVGQIGNVPALALVGESGAEAAEGTLANFPENPAQTAGTVGVIGADVTTTAAEAAVGSAKERPLETLGSLGGGVAASVAGGYALGKGARTASRATRGVRDRIRTAGSTDITDEIISQDVRRYYETGGEVGEKFPGAEDVAKFEDDQAAALREQATDYTPESVLRDFERAGVTEGVPLKKALGTEVEGPDSGRAGQGFEAPAEGTDLAEQYETIGQSFSPEVSPYFFEIDEKPDTRFSLRPGLPTTGRNKPTGVIVRTDIEETDASNVVELNEELRDAAGDTTARTLSPDEATPEEAEAVVPPEAEFADLGGSTRRNIARRLGIGSDYRVEIGGRRVPVRLAAPESEIDVGGSGLIRGFDDRGQVTSGLDVDLRPDSRRLDEFGERTAPVDRPLPVAPTTPSADSGSEARESDESVTGGSDRSGANEQPSTVSTDRSISRNIERSFTIPSLSSGSGLSDADDTSGGESRPDTDSEIDVGDPSKSLRPDNIRSSPTRPTIIGSTSSDSETTSAGDVPTFNREGISGFSGRSGVPNPRVGFGSPSLPGSGVSLPSSTTSTISTGTTTTTTTTETPVDPNTPPRARLADVDIDADEKEPATGLLGARNPELIDFLNPLSGDVIETESDLADEVDTNRQIQLR